MMFRTIPKKVLNDDEADDDTCKRILRSLVTSTREKMTVPKLAIQYKKTQGACFPFARFGNKSLLDYLASNPDIARLVANPDDEDNPLLEPVISERTAYMRHLVETQLENLKTNSPENASNLRKRFQTEEYEAIVSSNYLTNRYINSIKETDDSKIGLPVRKKAGPIPDSLVLTIFQILQKYGQDGLHKDDLMFELSLIGHKVENAHFFHTLKRCGNFFDVNDELFVSNKIEELPKNISEYFIDTQEGLQSSDSEDDEDFLSPKAIDNEKKTAFAKNLTLDTLELEKFNNMITFSHDLPTDVGRETGVEPPDREFQPGDILRLHITAFHDVNSFFFRLCSDNENFQHMRSSLCKVCNQNWNNPDFQVDPNKIYQRMDCVAKFYEQWERAIIYSILDPTTVKVFLVDCGSVETVNISELLHLPTFFQALPAQVFEGRLANVQPFYMAANEDDKLQERLDAFIKMTENYHLCAIVRKLNNNDAVIRPLLYNLELIDTNNKYDLNIGEELLRRGLVALESDCPRYLTNEIPLHSCHLWVDTYLYQLTCDDNNCETLRDPKVANSNHSTNMYGNNRRYDCETSSNENINGGNSGSHHIRSNSSSKIGDGNRRSYENNNERNFVGGDRENDFPHNPSMKRSHRSAYESQERRTSPSFQNTQNNNCFERESRRDVFDRSHNSRKFSYRNFGRDDRRNEFGDRNRRSYRINGEKDLTNGDREENFCVSVEETYKTNGDINFAAGNGRNNHGEGSRRSYGTNGENFGESGIESKFRDKNERTRLPNGENNFKENDGISERSRSSNSSGGKNLGSDRGYESNDENGEMNENDRDKNKRSLENRLGGGSRKSYGTNFRRSDCEYQFNERNTGIYEINDLRNNPVVSPSCKFMEDNGRSHENNCEKRSEFTRDKFGDQSRKTYKTVVGRRNGVSPESNFRERRRGSYESNSEKNSNRSGSERNFGDQNRKTYKISAGRSNGVVSPESNFREGSRRSYGSNGDRNCYRSGGDHIISDRNRKTYKIGAGRSSGVASPESDLRAGNRGSYESNVNGRGSEHNFGD